MDQNVVEETKSQSAHKYSSAQCETPECSVAVGLVHKGIEHKQAQGVAAEASEAEGTDVSQFHEQKAKTDTREDRTGQYDPADPRFGVCAQEGRVEKEHDEGSCEQDTSEEEDRLEESAAGKADDASHCHEENEHGPLVPIEPLPDSAQLPILAPVLDVDL